MKSRILLIVAVLLGAVLIAAQQNQNEMERNPLAGNPEASAAGERQFQQTCASCHGDGARAPSLATGAFARGSQDGEIFQMAGSSTLEATPLVVDGVMYVTGPPGTVVALDARTGRQIWRYQRTQKIRNPNEINPFNRGVAVRGNRLFFGTLDAALVALDARTGLALWEVQVADTMLGYSITSAPLVVKDKVLIGITGGEFGARGFLDGYDATTGRRAWRWYSVPGPGEFGNDTWAGDSWTLGGSPMWLTGSYDPALNLVYWTVGNPGPQTGASMAASPMSYAVGGRQFIAVSAGNVLYSFALPE